MLTLIDRKNVKIALMTLGLFLMLLPEAALARPGRRGGSRGLSRPNRQGKTIATPARGKSTQQPANVGTRPGNINKQTRHFRRPRQGSFKRALPKKSGRSRLRNRGSTPRVVDSPSQQAARSGRLRSTTRILPNAFEGAKLPDRDSRARKRAKRLFRRRKPQRGDSTVVTQPRRGSGRLCPRRC